MPKWEDSLSSDDLAMTDPYDMKGINNALSNPFKESRTRVGIDVMSALKKMASSPTFQKSIATKNLLSEVTGIELDDSDNEELQ
jgi:hypothetical protein